MKRLYVLYVMLFCSVAIAHNINWHDGEQIIETTTCDSGESITPPSAPNKYGYHFVKWTDIIPIEYIECTGTQYIDPDVTVGGNTRWELDSQLTNISRQNIFGSGGSTTPGLMSLRAGSSYSKFQFNRRNRVDRPGNLPVDKNRHLFVNDVYNGTVRIDSHEIYNLPAFSGTEYKIFICAYNSLGSANLSIGWLGRYYGLKIYSKDVLTHDFIPVLDKNGTPCMYDKITDTFFYNIGTGDFIAGPALWRK